MLTILFLLYCAIKVNTPYDLYTNDHEQIQFIHQWNLEHSSPKL